MRDEKSGKESKQVNFRIDPDSAEAFRLFCTTHGMNQAQDLTILYRFWN